MNNNNNKKIDLMWPKSKKYEEPGTICFLK